MANISIMTADDIGFAIAMTDYERWGNAPADFERLINLDPTGCFVAREDAQKVGMITTTTFNDYAFMGGLIIEIDHRRRGIGEALMRHAIEYLQRKGTTSIELDATFQGVPLYRKLGFRDKYLSFRLMRSASGVSSTKPNCPDYTPEEILSLDKQLTGLDRSNILSRLMYEFNNSVHLIRTDELRGYAFVFPRADLMMQIGPVVAESDEIAASLLSEIVRDNKDHHLAIGLPESSQRFTSVLLEHQFEYWEPTLRMFLGKKRDYESSIYGIVSPESG